MKRLRHPINSIREPFGKAGLTIAILALVLAMVGGAYAAGGLTKSQEKQVTKIAKKYAGKPGAPGAAGTSGTNGTNGKDGGPGAAGTNGKSVVTSTALVGSGAGKCEVSGTKFEVEGSGKSEVVCNGKNGTTGFTETLPSGKSEKGAWADLASTEPCGLGSVKCGLVPISYGIPLEAALPNENIHVLQGEFPSSNRATCEAESGTEKEECEENLEKEEEACPGTGAEPQAAPGSLCLYVTIDNTGISAHYVFNTTPAGAVVLVASTEPSRFALGSWAVTAP